MTDTILVLILIALWMISFDLTQIAKAINNIKDK